MLYYIIVLGENMTSRSELAKKYVNNVLAASKAHDITPIVNTLCVIAGMIAFQDKINLTQPQMLLIAVTVFAGLKSLAMISDIRDRGGDKQDEMTAAQNVFTVANPVTVLTSAVAATVGAIKGEKGASVSA